MSEIRWRCSACNASQVAESGMAGVSVNCPSCFKVLRVPEVAVPAAPPPRASAQGAVAAPAATEVAGTSQDLDSRHAIWVVEREIGKAKVLKWKGERIEFRVPEVTEKPVTLRLRGLGRADGTKRGNLLLTVSLNRGADLHAKLWVSETAAKLGADKYLVVDPETPWSHVVPVHRSQPRTTRTLVRVPKGCANEAVVEVPELGEKARFHWRRPLAPRSRGRLLVRVQVYPDEIAPDYRPFADLDTETIALEGWVYRRFDALKTKVGALLEKSPPVRAEEIADLFNGDGWWAIFKRLVKHLDLHPLVRNGRLELRTVAPAADTPPGCCRTTVKSWNKVVVDTTYSIRIRSDFLDSPFLVAAILSHELCHVVHFLNCDPPGTEEKTGDALLELERQVDLLVFMLGLGEAQLRVARDTRFRLGYFRQEVFERMQQILARKRKG